MYIASRVEANCCSASNNELLKESAFDDESSLSETRYAVLYVSWECYGEENIISLHHSAY
jgi:hypothetical protein